MEGNTTGLTNATEVFRPTEGLTEVITEMLPDVARIPLPVAAAEFTTYKVASATHIYLLPIIVLIGLIGNTLSFLIMLKPHNRRISCCNYMAALAVSDNFMLVNAANYWTVSFKDRPIWNYECKVLAWMFQALSFVSMILIFSMTVDRFLAIRFPFMARTLCSVYRSRVAIACIVTFSVLYTLPYLFTSQLIIAARTCIAVATNKTLAVIYNWLNIFLGSIVPFVGLLTLNGLIIITVRTRATLSESTGHGSSETPSHKPQQTEVNGTDNSAFQPDPSVIPSGKTSSKMTRQKSEKSKSKRARENQLTIMLLLVTITFLILTLPQYARYLVAVFWDYTASPGDYADYLLLAHASNRLFYMNNACNFFLYCVSGNKFRQDVSSLFPCRK